MSAATDTRFEHLDREIASAYRLLLDARGRTGRSPTAQNIAHELADEAHLNELLDRRYRQQTQ